MLKKFTPEMVKKITLGGLVAAVVAFELLIVVLLFNELSPANFRATDRALMLLALLFLPVLILLVSRLLGGFGFINLKLPGNLEIQIKNFIEEKVEQTEQNIDKKITEKAKQLEEQWEGKLSTAEQTLYPIVGGPNAFARQHLEGNKVVIGSKNFGANIVVAELVAQYIEMQGIEVERLIPNGGTLTNYAFLQNGWIDLFIDYTGTGCLFLNVPYRNRSTGRILDDLNRLSKERYKSEWLKPFGTKTNYCLLVSKALAEREKLRDLSQLSGKLRGQLRFCGNYEFMNRRDGLPGLKDFYNMRFSKETICSYQERYQFVIDGKADVAVGHTTDPDIHKHDLVILADDKKFFPDYYETPVVRTEALEAIPKLHDLLEEIAGLGLEDADITSLMQDYRENEKAINEQVRSMLLRKKYDLETVGVN